MPRLPRERTVFVAKCHACHAKCHGVTGDENRPKRATRANPVPEVPRKTQVDGLDVTKFNACHAKCRGAPATKTAPSAPPEPAKCHKCHACHTQSAAASPATKTAPSAPPEPAQCHMCHVCHAKRRWMSPSATPATRNDGACRQVPRLPRKVPRRHRRPKPPQARHQIQPSAIYATRATQNAGGCRWKDGG